MTKVSIDTLSGLCLELYAEARADGGITIRNVYTKLPKRKRVPHLSFMAGAEKLDIHVRPAWALSCGCKSRREEVILIEANRSCVRATERGKEAGSETAGRCTRTGSEAASTGASGHGTAKLR